MDFSWSWCLLLPLACNYGKTVVYHKSLLLFKWKRDFFFWKLDFQGNSKTSKKLHQFQMPWSWNYFRHNRILVHDYSQQQTCLIISCFTALLLLLFNVLLVIGITTRARVLNKERIILLRQITKNTFFKAAKMSQDEMHLVSYRNWWQRGDLHLTSSKPPYSLSYTINIGQPTL